MKCYINNIVYNHKEILRQDMGYGQPFEGKQNIIKIVFNKEELFLRIADVFDNFVNETKEDDLRFNEIDIPELIEIGYPHTREMVEKYPEIFCNIIMDYDICFLHQMLKSDSSLYSFILNRLSAVYFMDDEFILEGIGYFLDKPFYIS